MAPSLIASVVCLALWALLVFIRPVGLGVVHLLLVVGAVLWVRWWAMRPVGSEEGRARRE